MTNVQFFIICIAFLVAGFLIIGLISYLYFRSKRKHFEAARKAAAATVSPAPIPLFFRPDNNDLNLVEIEPIRTNVNL